MYKYFDNDDVRFFKILACISAFAASSLATVIIFGV